MSFGQPQPGGWGPPPGPPGIQQGTLYGGAPTDQERQWAMISHIGCLVGGFVVPMIFMLVDVGGQPSPFVKHHAKQSLIFCFVIIVVGMLTCGIGIFVGMIFQVLAGLAANKGEWYVYPGLGGFVDQPTQ